MEEIHLIEDRVRLAAYPFYSAALGELELGCGKHEIARGHFRAALALARNPMERRFLEQRVGECEPGNATRALAIELPPESARQSKLPGVR